MKSNPLRNMATVAVLRWWHDFSAPRQRRQNSKVGRHSKMEGHTKAIRTLLVTFGVAAITCTIAFTTKEPMVSG
jgi:hypothetical protein